MPQVHSYHLDDAPNLVVQPHPQGVTWKQPARPSSLLPIPSASSHFYGRDNPPRSGISVRRAPDLRERPTKTNTNSCRGRRKVTDIIKPGSGLSSHEGRHPRPRASRTLLSDKRQEIEDAGFSAVGVRRQHVSPADYGATVCQGLREARWTSICACSRSIPTTSHFHKGPRSSRPMAWPGSRSAEVVCSGRATHWPSAICARRRSGFRWRARESRLAQVRDGGGDLCVAGRVDKGVSRGHGRTGRPGDAPATRRDRPRGPLDETICGSHCAESRTLDPILRRIRRQGFWVRVDVDRRCSCRGPRLEFVAPSRPSFPRNRCWCFVHRRLGADRLG